RLRRSDRDEGGPRTALTGGVRCRGASRIGAPSKIRYLAGVRGCAARFRPRKSGRLVGTMLAARGSVKKFALLSGCVLFLACSSDGGNAGPGHGGQGGGQAGSTGSGGSAGGGGSGGGAGKAGGGGAQGG